MLLIGLTGSIGMGKSETARMFQAEGLPVYDADAAVHELYAPGGAAVAPIAAAFPGVERDGAVDRAALGDRVLGQPAQMKKLEAIIHPLVRHVQELWLAEQAERGAAMVVLDIPLLLETAGPTKRTDVVVVVSAPAALQRQRVLARQGMTEDKLDAILAKQMPDGEKRKHADFVVDTSQGLDHARAQVRAIIGALKGRQGTLWTGLPRP